MRARQRPLFGNERSGGAVAVKSTETGKGGGDGAADGFSLRAESSMARISRDPQDLAGQLFDGHDWPDGVVLYLGTMFAPTRDRPRSDGKELIQTRLSGVQH